MRAPMKTQGSVIKIQFIVIINTAGRTKSERNKMCEWSENSIFLLKN